MTEYNKLQIQSLISSLYDIAHLSTQADIAQARTIVADLHSKFSLSANYLFTPCSGSVVDYSCPERAKFLELVDNSL
jgi:hypothetical protein